MKRVSHNDSYFYICSNYPYCKYKTTDIDTAKKGIKCPDCDAHLVQITGRYGAFYGCSNYPWCKYTRNIK